jgi:flagellar basal body P-ring formation chaperone FlgA
MRRFVIATVAMGGVFALASLPCRADPACTKVAVEASVAAGEGELTLADLLPRGACPQLHQAAARVHLGAVPRPGSVRVFDGRRVRLLLEGLAYSKTQRVKKAAGMRIPERIVVRRAGAMKSCAEIAGFLAGATPMEEIAVASPRWQENLDCAAGRSIPEAAPLELTRAEWNEALQRWEFMLRCTRPQDCVPFLVWTRDEKKALVQLSDARRRSARRVVLLANSYAGVPEKAGSTSAVRLVKPGQTAILTWEQAGIRVVLPVTCLDAGGLGEFVRVQLKNVGRTLRAEVVGEGTLRASL